MKRLNVNIGGHKLTHYTKGKVCVCWGEVNTLHAYDVVESQLLFNFTCFVTFIKPYMVNLISLIQCNH